MLTCHYSLLIVAADWSPPRFIRFPVSSSPIAASHPAPPWRCRPNIPFHGQKTVAPPSHESRQSRRVAAAAANSLPPPVGELDHLHLVGLLGPDLRRFPLPKPSTEASWDVRSVEQSRQAAVHVQHQDPIQESVRCSPCFLFWIRRGSPGKSRLHEL